MWMVKLLLLCAWMAGALAGAVTLTGNVADPQGRPVAGASVRVIAADGIAANATTGDDGHFAAELPGLGAFVIETRAEGFADLRQSVVVTAGARPLELRFTALAAHADSVNVSADVRDTGILSPDPAQRVLVREEILDANPGRPGAPVSIPGLPIESASGGIKAPQYFAPGVAGDHGEPVATFFQVGTYLVPNNLSANAHGNGYSDPNPIVPAVIESVTVDGGAFNVREGNHSVDLAETWGFRARLEPSLAFTGDAHDADMMAGWDFLALEAAWGDGFLKTPERRRQYKLNAFHVFDVGQHKLTLFGAGYYGESKVPGLTPIDVSGLDDTIDPRQRDQTHTGEVALNDVWRLAPANELQLSGFFRTYNLALDSNFGDGLIRQSEFRTVSGANATWVRRLTETLTFMAGVDTLGDAPRRLDLDHLVGASFQTVTSNNVTLNFLAPYAALSGRLASWLRYSAGWRRDQIGFDNQDLLNPANSLAKWVGVNSPKATVDLIAPRRLPLPSASFSFGQSFFTNDPRVGTGTVQGTPVSRAHSWQAVVSKEVLGTEFRVTLARVTQEQSLAKIDPDTGLQFDEGPGRNLYITAVARRYFRGGMLQASVSKADARDLSTGLPVPEAPRLITDFLGTLDRLPFHLQARAEYEQVGRKPLGDGFISIPVREFRGSLARPFREGRIMAGINLLIAGGYTGQTTEVLALPGEGEPFERIVGVRLPSYVAASCTWRLRR
jgi:Carboxypeptidase regulatory-like domain